jgi:hypothetical protein
MDVGFERTEVRHWRASGAPRISGIREIFSPKEVLTRLKKLFDCKEQPGFQNAPWLGLWENPRSLSS